MSKEEDSGTGFRIKDPEAFAHNLARVVEEAGKAAAAYLKPREEGKASLDFADGIGEVVKTISKVTEYWLAEPERVVEAQSRLWAGYLGLWSSSLKRMMGEPAPPAAEPEGEGKRADEDGALDEILGVVGCVQHGQPVEEDADEDGADHGADHVRPALVEDGKADQRCRHAVKEQRCAARHVAAADAGTGESG